MELTESIESAKKELASLQTELANQKTLLEKTKVVEDYRKSKFTDENYYQYIIGNISALFYEHYQLALETVLTAQKSYQYELNSDKEFVDIDYLEW